ncbi:protein STRICTOSIDINE SYNTHASE-LIKE 6-like [Euphorbia lathyris]|uniref:protein STRICTOSIDINE SYNTHASE-LIKE 6-like n=1 Tax=Euphorbia lathyris TaxID=212925 RepID=UPI0033139A9D
MLNNRRSQLIIFFLLLTPVLAAARLFYRVNSSNSDPLFNNDNELISNISRRRKPEILGKGKLKGPEDILHDEKSGVIYTGCRDGWIKRVKPGNSAKDTVVENWVNTGGRPLGLSWMHGTKEMIVADAYKGLLKIEENGKIRVLTEEANGKKFKLTDGVTVAKDGKIYFTDASSKYNMKNFMLDIFEGKPNGRLLSYDPKTSETLLLASGLYFPNGVALSPNQDFLVFCETPERRCRQYYIEGERKGSVENFIELPTMPDNIHFKDGHFWIAAAMVTFYFLFSYQLMISGKKNNKFKKNGYFLPEAATKMGKKKREKGRVYVVNLEGKVSKTYSGTALKLVASGVKIGNYLYCGSIFNYHIVRLPLSHG